MIQFSSHIDIIYKTSALQDILVIEINWLPSEITRVKNVIKSTT